MRVEYCTYDKECEQNQAPDGCIERLKDTERVGNVDGEGGAPHDDRQSEMLERSDEVDDLPARSCDRYRRSCHVRRVAVISLMSNQSTTDTHAMCRKTVIRDYFQVRGPTERSGETPGSEGSTKKGAEDHAPPQNIC